MYDISGVNLTEGKRELVRARLSKRLRALDRTSFREYVDFVESDAGRLELSLMVDTLTTNKTSFFRELPHFTFLREEVLPSFSDSDAPLRIWSAGCSSGEEPYSLAILLYEHFSDFSKRDIRILATDLSRKSLARAREAVYGESQMEGVPAPIRSRCFERIRDGSGEIRFRVIPELRKIVHLAPLNLMETWPMRGPFHVIFCRNVMIYFDKGKRERLVSRFTRLLPPGGHLMVGHSESLNGLSHGLSYVQPAVYRK
jgi:chemotaxis protein methyltransferase CheR